MSMIEPATLPTAEGVTGEAAAVAVAPSAPSPASVPPPVTPEAIRLGQSLKADLFGEIHKRIVGQDEVIELLLLSLLAQGHGLFIGVPGLAKTLLISTLAESLGLGFNRVQFTPDLMPADITGTEILEENRSTGQRSFRFVRGPIFTNILLADEINRTSPKTQAALLQAMQERRVTVNGATYPLDAPFLVFATQNPIEQEGTYPLPEAQLDRFMFSVVVNYPSAAEEARIVVSTTGASLEKVEPVAPRERILEIQELVRQVPVSEPVVEYAVRLARATRPADENAGESVRKWVSWGAGPRASQYLILGGKARAILHGRPAVTVADVRALAGPVLRHRIVVNFQAEAEGVTPDRIVLELLDQIRHA